MKLEKNNLLLNDLYLLKSFGYKFIGKNNFDLNNDIKKLPDTLEELDEIIDNCTLCNIANICKSKTAYIGNNINSRIVIITSKIINKSNEYELLENILKNILNIDIKDIIILNLLKCDVQNSIINEIDRCKNYTLKQLDILKPKLIISLGETYNYLLNDNNINKDSLLKYNGITLFISEEPEYILRNPSIKNDVYNRYKKIKNYMEKM